MRVHIVQKGETLWRIAKHYGIGLEELKNLNSHLANPDYIVPGMEIILPESHSGTHTAPMTKEQKTAPMTPKEIQTAPKEKLTQPVKPVEKVQPAKEMPKVKHTAPIPATVPQPMPQPMPMPMPMPQVDLMPQFQFDFAPQMHFQQPHQPAPMPAPAPQPMPMPMPQPIFIHMPAPQQQVETKVETTVEKEKEYVPVPQPQIIYVPYMPQQNCPPPNPCRCHEQHHFKNPCGCHEQQHHYQNPCGCQEPHYQQSPYGYQEYDGHMMPQQHDYQSMPQQYDCGCGGSGYSHEMMPYGMPYFEPNYDMAGMGDVAPAMDYEESDGLPDWLLDSSEIKSKADMGHNHHMMPEHEGYEESMDYDYDQNQEQVAGHYQDGNHYGHGAYPYSQQNYGHPPMHYGMADHMNYNSPQQMHQPNCQGYPQMSQYPHRNMPWNY